MAEPKVIKAELSGSMDKISRYTAQHWKLILAITLTTVAAGTGVYWVTTSKSRSDPKAKRKTAQRATKESSADAKSKTYASVASKTGLAEPAASHIKLKAEEIAKLSDSERTNLAGQAKIEGNTYYKSKDFEKAIEEYSYAIALNPTDIFYSNRAACYTVLKDWKNVIQDCTDALTLNKKGLKAVYRRAGAYEEIQEDEKSLLDYTAACVLSGFKQQEWIQDCHRLLEKIVNKQYEEKLKNPKHDLPSKTFIDTYMAGFRLSASDLDKLVKNTYTSAGDQAIHSLISLMIKKDWHAAWTLSREIYDNDAEDLNEELRLVALNAYASFCFLSFDSQKGQDCVQKMLKIQPKQEDALLKLAAVKLENKDVEGALADSHEIVSAHPLSAYAIYYRAQVETIAGQDEAAVVDLEKAVSLDPTFLLASIQLGTIQRRLNKESEADKTFKDAEKLFADDETACGLLNNYRGEIELHMGNIDIAENYFEKSARLIPNSPLPLLNMSLLAGEHKQDWAKMESCCKKALETDPRCELAYMQLAQLYTMKENYDLSLQMYDKAIEVAVIGADLKNILSLREIAVSNAYIATHYAAEMAQSIGRP